MSKGKNLIRYVKHIFLKYYVIQHSFRIIIVQNQVSMLIRLRMERRTTGY